MPGNKHKLTPSAKAMGVHLPVSTPLATGKVLIANLIRLFQATENVCFGSLAAVQHHIRRTSAFGRKADVHEANSNQAIAASPSGMTPASHNSHTLSARS